MGLVQVGRQLSYQRQCRRVSRSSLGWVGLAPPRSVLWSLYDSVPRSIGAKAKLKAYDSFFPSSDDSMD